MITAFFLCALLTGGLGCLPFATLPACEQAERALVLTESSGCTAAEILVPTYAPAGSPIPKARP